MTTRVLHYAGLPAREREGADTLPSLVGADQVELRVRQDGREHVLILPEGAVRAVSTLLTSLIEGDRVAVLAEDQELTPAEAAEILGMSRPMVVLRMDRGDLPFRMVGSHRRVRLADVLKLQAAGEARQKALDALAADTEDLICHHEL
jgi:excisionase family DNA binding protein